MNTKNKLKSQIVQEDFKCEFVVQPTKFEYHLLSNKGTLSNVKKRKNVN